MRILDELTENGYTIIEGLGLDRPNDLLEETMATISKPIAYLGLPMVMDLKPQPGYQPASFAGTGVFNLHTDLTWHEKPPKYLGMFCVQYETAGGGIPLLSDGWKALADMDEADTAYLKEAPVSFQPPSHINYPKLSGPVISGEADRPFVRFRYDMLDDPDPALTRYNEAVNRHVFEVRVSPGSIFIFDNYRMLHGRTELKGGMESDRHFKRIYGDT